MYIKNLLFPGILMFLWGCMGFADVKSRPGSQAGASGRSFYDFNLKTLEGKDVSLANYKGKKILIVNTASKCGFTRQYEDLQKFWEMHKDSVVVLGFPSNDFGNQEPGTSEQIGEFCKKNFGVTFQLMEKTKVKGKNKHPLFNWLSDPALNGWNDQEPSWNFCKYLISEKGELLGFYGSAVGPFSQKISDDLKRK
jgi:glutathione peroxidase